MEMTDKELGVGRWEFADDDTHIEADPKFDAWIAKQASGVNKPTATPRAEMWREIEAATKASRAAQQGEIPGVTPLRRHWKLMSVIAAALLLGVALDRTVLRQQRTTAQVATLPP